ncbi:MAG: DUF433 domain-containing protein [Sphingobacteriales bacterium]|jgi:uncharacterized protein (DUF433 family)|nr:DUF433 domain-containing protein [Sphingobacteriales bacterium]
MLIANLIHTDPDILGGTAVFYGTRVPIQTLFWHLEKNISIDEFLDDFPSVSKQQVLAVLHLVAQSFNNQKIINLYETAVG